MDAVMLIERARLAGLSLSVADGKLKISGKETASTASLVGQMGKSKQSIIDFLSGVQPAPTSPSAVEIQPVVKNTDEWEVTGIPTLREALAIQQELSAQHGPRSTVCGMDKEAGTFYVRPRWWTETGDLVKTAYPRFEGMTNG